jgi:hypothetical protein
MSCLTYMYTDGWILGALLCMNHMGKFTFVCSECLTQQLVYGGIVVTVL